MGGYFLLLVFVNVAPARKWLGGIFANVLHDKLQTEVLVGEVEIGLFNRIILRDVQIKDQDGRLMLDGGLLSAKIALAPLLKGSVSLRSVSLLDVSVRLCKASLQTVPNFQFVIDAFSSKQKDSDSRLDLKINSLILRRCRLRYDEFYRPETKKVLNPSHLDVRDISANLSLRCLTPDSLSLRVRSLEFREQCGWNVNSLMFRMTANRHSCSISNFELLMSGSHFRQDSLMATYDATTDWKNFLGTLTVAGVISNAVVATKDIAVFLPSVRPFDYTLFVTASFSLTPNEWVLKKITVDEKNGKIGMQGNVCMRKRDNRWEYVEGRLTEMHFDAADIAHVYTEITQKTLPDFVPKLGLIELNGNFDYANTGIGRFVGNVKSDAGGLRVSLSRKGNVYSLQTQSEGLSVARLLQNDGLPCSLSFETNTVVNASDSRKPDVHSILDVAHVDFRGYMYRNLRLDAYWNGKTVTSAFASQDENFTIDGNVSAMFDGRRFESPKLAARIRTLAPQRLNLYDKWGDARFSATINADFSELNLKSPVGCLEMRDFVMKDAEHTDDYRLDILRMDFSPSRRGTHFKLFSDFAQADIDGRLSLGALKECVRSLFLKNIRQELSEPVGERQIADSQWRFSLRVNRDDFFQKLLQLPLSLSGAFTAEGILSAGKAPSSVVAHSDGISYGSVGIRDIRFYLSDTGNSLSCLAQGLKQIGTSDMRFVFETKTSEGRLLSALNWDDGGSHRYYGSLKTVARFAPDVMGDTIASFDIQPTEIVVGDTIWAVTPGRFDWRKKGFDVASFRLEHADQSLALSGGLSANASDSLVAELHRLEVGYVMNLINLKPVSFSGPASGKIRLWKDSDKQLQVAGALHIPGFYFNDSPMGVADIDGRWNAKEGRLWLDADMHDGDTVSTLVRGFVGIAEKGLDLHVASRNTNLRFLRRYLSDILGSIEGRTTGQCRIYGPFKALDFDGEERPVLTASLPVTGVGYRVDDGVLRMSSGCFSFSGFRLSDKERGVGALDGKMTHNHLSDVNYDFQVSARNLLMYDQPQTPNTSFYATTYGTGSIALRGRPGLITADINIRPDDRTLFTYIVDSPESFDNSQLLRFDNRDRSPETTLVDTAQLSPVAQPTTASTDIVLNFLIDMTPQATLKVVTNEKSGDYILMNGHGPIRATYYNKAPFQMFGTLTVDRGEYKMSIQDIIRKDFGLQSGGRIIFAGDPLEADLDLKAVYSVPSASLSDLNVGANIADNSVRVNCILKLGGKAGSPSVTFDLDLPTVGDDVKQMVRQLIATEEDINMQILYLLGVGRFYTYNYADTQSALGGQSQSSLAMKSFLSNTLSSQLNNIIANAVGASNWTFGANLATGQVGWSDMEVAGLLTGRLLNNRLLLNGNFGYRDRATATTGFVGDFDISYLLTPTGTVSLKAYSETNDRYFSKSSLTTQGIGIKLRRDFTNFRDLFTTRRRANAQKSKARKEK